MFLQKGFRGKNEFWRYLVTFIVIVGASQLIGGIFVAILLLLSGALFKSVDFSNLSLAGLDPNFALIIMLIPFILGLAALLLMIKYLHNKRIVDVITGRNKIDWSKILFSGTIWLILLIIVNVAHYFHNPENMIFQFEGINFIILVFIALLFIPLQASFEELLFRGYLLQGFGVAFRYRWVAILIPALFFAGLHVMNPEVKEFGFFLVMPQYLIFGLLFGIITVIDDGLESALGVHAINNIFLALFITHKSSALQTPALFKIKELNPVLDLLELIVASILFVFILSIKYKWKNWRKLFGKV